MKSRQPIGYVVQIEGRKIILNFLDEHRGYVASHSHGVSRVTEIGSPLAIEFGSKLLVIKISSLSFAEPKEVHKHGIGTRAQQSAPLRHITGILVGRLERNNDSVDFVPDSISSPTLGAESYPLTAEELAALLGNTTNLEIPINLGKDLRSGENLKIDLEDLVSRHVAVLGSTGQGKSCFTAAILQQMVKLPNAHIVVFDINGEYESAFENLISSSNASDAVLVTQLGGNDGYKIPYYALGRYGLQRLLIPSEKTQRPALSFALDNLNKVKWFEREQGLGLSDDDEPFLFSDCRQDNSAKNANIRIEKLRKGTAQEMQSWPPMQALCPLIAESHSNMPTKNGRERSAFAYSNISPLITRINRFVEDKFFSNVVDVKGNTSNSQDLEWEKEANKLVEKIFGGTKERWKVHIVNLRLLSHDLTPFVLGSLLELYANVLFQRGQENKKPTLLVLEEAHHYLRSMSAYDDDISSALSYERLAKEGRKFGLALWLSTQRPSEISPTVLSQCNNWVTFKLNSEKDISFIQAASEWGDSYEIRRISGLPRQHAIVFGGSLKIPTIVCAPTANPLPKSQDGEFNRWKSLPRQQNS